MIGGSRKGFKRIVTYRSVVFRVEFSKTLLIFQGCFGEFQLEGLGWYLYVGRPTRKSYLRGSGAEEKRGETRKGNTKGSEPSQGRGKRRRKGKK